MKILAIDDNPDNLTVLKAVLLDRLPEASLLAVTSGAKGLELAAAEDPDVILLDIVMPGMDGYDVCRKLKTDARFKAIPVLFLTAHTDRDSRIKAVEAGADGFLSKPFDDLELKVQILAMTKLKAANRLHRLEKEKLAALVAERTQELERELAERRRAEEELRTLLTAVEQSANMIEITDPNGNIEYVNPAFEKGTGYSSAEAIGRNPRILKSGRQDHAFYETLWETILSGKIWRGEFHNRRKDGSLYWESATISPVQNDKGKTVHFIAIKEDITGRKAMEASLAEALDHAEAASRAKSEFLAIMSHELRTPLNGVLGFGELLADTTSLDEEQNSYAEMIIKSGKHLLSIVNDILDFSSIEKGAMAIHVAPVAVAELVAASAQTIRKSAAGKGLSFESVIGSGVPDQILGDGQRIRQILINLLGNAVKFTASGSVSLRVSVATEEGGPFLDFAVLDTGIGLAPETIGILFQPFTQAEMKMSRTFGGTGLGLAISKRLAETMGGSLTVRSTVGEGSTFTFRLPLEISDAGMADGPADLADRAGNTSAPTEQRPPAQAGATPAEGDPVLVVEDDPDNSKLADKMLSAIGCRAEFAFNGREAVEAFRPGKFRAILMDMQMPVMNGLAATEQIREIEAQSGSRVPIIALTANVMPGDRERCLAAGMDDFLTKPFNKTALAAKLARATACSSVCEGVWESSD
jgi:hypothetical protein